ncbi:MAG: hypothetical protein ACTSQJ_16820 [Promethearchaeota archaeon]
MNISVDYEKLLEETLLEELNWFEEEFDSLFEKKIDNYSKQDLNIGTKILDNLTKKINNLNNEKLIHFLAKTLNNIERKYPHFFL